jgi:hypothetical protein
LPCFLSQPHPQPLETLLSDCCAMLLPLLHQSAAKSIGEDARTALSEANGEAEKLILPIHCTTSGEDLWQV